jgi:hypothetical protein
MRMRNALHHLAEESKDIGVFEAQDAAVKHIATGRRPRRSGIRSTATARNSRGGWRSENRLL